MSMQKGMTLLAAVLIPLSLATADEVVVYSTGFEADQGYETGITLVGQGETAPLWQSLNVGANGIDSGLHPSLGQYAFIGLSPFQDLEAENFTQFVWKPLPQPIPQAGRPIAVFRVTMSIAASLAPTANDCFRWIAFNPDGDQLFALDFDNESKRVNYVLNNDPGLFHFTGTSFENDHLYELAIAMDFDSDTWSASLDGEVLVTDVAITIPEITSALGDVDAVWAIRDVANPGDNFMIFDDYRVTALSVTDIPPVLSFQGFNNDGSLIHLSGAPNTEYELQATGEDFMWSTIADLTTSANGTAAVTDSAGNTLPNQFYRAKLK